MFLPFQHLLSIRMDFVECKRANASENPAEIRECECKYSLHPYSVLKLNAILDGPDFKEHNKKRQC